MDYQGLRSDRKDNPGNLFNATAMPAPSASGVAFRNVPTSAVILPNPVEPRGKLLYKLLAVFLSLSLLPLLVAGFLLIHIGNQIIQTQIIGTKQGIAQK